MDESTDSNDLGWEFEPSKHEISYEWADDKLRESGDDESPFFEDRFEIGAGKHKANADDGERGGGAADVADSVGDETRQFNASEKNYHAEEDGDNIGVGDDTFD